MLGKSLGTAA